MGRPHKYHAQRTTYREQTFDSRGEAEYARHLDLLKAAGHIKDWQRGRVWVLLDAPKARDRVTMRPDFEVWDNRGYRVLDFKGMLTREFRLKVKLWKAVHPTIPFWIVKSDGREEQL